MLIDNDATQSLQGSPWTMQIHLMADLYDLPASMPSLDPGPSDNGEREHILEVMGIMDMPSFTLGRKKPSVGIWKALRKAQASWADGISGGVEVVTGLPKSLLDIFGDMLDSDDDETERRFLAWPGHMGNYLQCHLWECCRLSGVLEVRRRRWHRVDKASAGALTPLDNYSPPTEVVMCRLMAAMDALYGASGLPRHKHLLVHNGMKYPLTMACLEAALLRAHPEWEATLREVRGVFERRDGYTLTRTFFGLIDEVWEESSGRLDIDEIARARGLELAIF